MTQYVAFLRGINVGGHTVKMDQLRKAFEALGFARVSTFIASGNVVFHADDTDPIDLEQRIEEALLHALGYAVATFLRTDAEVARIAAHQPFPNVESQARDSQYVVFLRSAPDSTMTARILDLANDTDHLHLDGRELHWLIRGNLNDSTLGNAFLGNARGPILTTVRNLNTIRRLAVKFSFLPPDHMPPTR